jgi:hypothetical protein
MAKKWIGKKMKKKNFDRRKQSKNLKLQTSKKLWTSD